MPTETQFWCKTMQVKPYPRNPTEQINQKTQQRHENVPFPECPNSAIPSRRAWCCGNNSILLLMSGTCQASQTFTNSRREVYRIQWGKVCLTALDSKFLEKWSIVQLETAWACQINSAGKRGWGQDRGKNATSQHLGHSSIYCLTHQTHRILVSVLWNPSVEMVSLYQFHSKWTIRVLGPVSTPTRLLLIVLQVQPGLLCTHHPRINLAGT